MQLIQSADIKYIATGAAVLGTGGGGDPVSGRLMAEAAIKTHGPVRLLSVDEVPQQAWIVPASSMGAPTVSVEKLQSWAEIDNSFDDAEAELGQKAFGTMPIEIGGSNGLIPIVVAARRGLPVIDADAMGRAFPEAHMVSFAVRGMVTRFVCMADEKGNRVMLKPINGQWQELLARPVVDMMGASAMVCDFPVTGAELRSHGLAGSITLARQIGMALHDQAQHQGDPLGALLATTNGYRLLTGKIVDLDRTTEGGFARGSVSIEGIDADRGRRMTIQFQNEFLLALENGSARAITPDLIAILDRDSALPWTTEALRYGMRIHVIGMPCNPIWRTPEGLAAVGPGHFGYDMHYTKIEQLAGGAT